MKISLFIPVLNEIEGLKHFLPQIPKGLFHQILIVDGNSKDGTVEWAKSEGYQVIVQKRKGLRRAYTEGWPHLTGDYVVTFSPDGNCRVEDLLPLVEKLQTQNFDMVIASRYAKGSGSGDDDMITGFGNWMFTTLINFFFKGHYTDVMTIYRGYKTHLHYTLDLHKDFSYWQEKVFATVVGLEPLLSIRAAKSKLKVGEIPSFEPPRMFGVRKLQIIRWGSAHVLQVLWEIIYWRPKSRS